MNELSVKSLCLSKVEGIFIRAWDLIRLVPLRGSRIARHVYDRLRTLVRTPSAVLDFRANVLWLVELVGLLLDLGGVAEIYETLGDFIKFNTRPLSSGERAQAEQVFGPDLNYRRVRIDEFAFAGPRFYHFAYVGFYTINSWGKLPAAILVHELVHIWQYEQMGSIYIPRALQAQYSEAGYDYGGAPALRQVMEKGGDLRSFNLEQQADIVADYYRLKQGKNPRWANKSSIGLDVYEKLMEVLDERNNSQIEQGQHSDA